MFRLPVLISIFQIFSLLAISQGVPPGWQYTVTPVTHIISIPLSCNPDINGYPLEPGDYIGVFYVNNSGTLTCGGAVEWWGDQNVGLIAFGDDTWSPVKDGFSANELINWKVFSWRVNKEYSATVTYNTSLPNFTGLFVSNGLSGLSSLDAFGLFVWATADPDTACVGMPVNLNAVPSGSSDYTFSWVSVPAGFNSIIPNPVVYPNIGTKYVITVSAGGDFVRDTVSPVISPGPMGSVGSNAAICQDQIYQANAYATNYSSLLWQTSGDGLFSDPSLLNPEYIPGSSDIFSGSVTLTMSVFPIEPCSGIISPSLILTIQKLPEISAGDDQLVCESTTVQLLAEYNYSSEIIWETTGDGTFSNPQMTNPYYTPGPEDIESGSVLLQVTAFPISPCTVPVSDEIVISFSRLASCNAGTDLIVCEDLNIEISGSASDYSGVLWSTTGDGIFQNPENLNTVYTPGQNDILTGSLYLTLTAYSIEPCTGSATDSMLLSVQYKPQVDAGDDFTIASGQPVDLSGQGVYISSVLWSSSGDGVFSNPDQLITQYFHGPGDRSTGGARLYLEAQAIMPCSVSVTDSLFVTIDTTVSIPDRPANRIFTFPNPARDELQLSLPLSTSPYFIKIYGMDGVLKRETEFYSGIETAKFDISDLESGIYCLDVYLRNINIYSWKIVVSK